MLQPSWSPDSKWLAYAKRLPNYMGAVFLHSVGEGKSTQVTDGMSDAVMPVFDAMANTSTSRRAPTRARRCSPTSTASAGPRRAASTSSCCRRRPVAFRARKRRGEGGGREAAAGDKAPADAKARRRKPRRRSRGAGRWAGHRAQKPTLRAKPPVAVKVDLPGFSSACSQSDAGAQLRGAADRKRRRGLRARGARGLRCGLRPGAHGASVRPESPPHRRRPERRGVL